LAKIFEAVQECRCPAIGSDDSGNYGNLEAEGKKSQEKREKPLLKGI
jgi:hypothetical protein